MSVEPRDDEVHAEVANSPDLLLAEHHRATEQACTALLARRYSDDPLELVAHYRSFEHALLEHLAAEDELILPAYAEHAPTEAQAIRDDHAAIRKALNRIGLEVELHVVRAHSVNELVDSLRAHAAREDTVMYPWAQVHLPPVTRRQLFLRIGRSLRALVQFRRRRAPELGPDSVHHTGYAR